MILDCDNETRIPIHLPEIGLAKNHRVATRYIRKDITVSISGLHLFELGRVSRVELLDISSKGLLIECQRKLTLRKKIKLSLRFKSGKEFQLQGTVIRISTTSPTEYGIKFDRFNDELGDYLLETQEHLIFK
ncbi:MAG: PilZ domain-containing protein [Methylovulum sp.]|nr:PilZ domain-containing protein [Methylovulum sp.]MCF7998727.1 PilZ domain-containing protein [Methylovulum sp.]